jgi:hypothetical protein
MSTLGSFYSMALRMRNSMASKDLPQLAEPHHHNANLSHPRIQYRLPVFAHS